ncbi:unnamed protein product, partial [Rotaria magnacalcarata]
VARKLLIQENELEKAEDRAKRSEMKCVDLEHEVKNLHHQLKSFLARIDDAQNKEQTCEDQIRRLSQHLKDAERRSDLVFDERTNLQKSVGILAGIP